MKKNRGRKYRVKVIGETPATVQERISRIRAGAVLRAQEATKGGHPAVMPGEEKKGC